jgi:hypothetical protein
MSSMMRRRNGLIPSQTQYDRQAASLYKPSTFHGYYDLPKGVTARAIQFNHWQEVRHAVGALLGSTSQMPSAFARFGATDPSDVNK